MAGAPPPIETTFGQIRKIQDQLLTLGPQVGGASPLSALSDPAFLELRRSLRLEAVNLPSPVNAWVAQIAQGVSGSVGSDAARELEQRVSAARVVAECRVRVEGRYPFGSAGEMSLGDFGQVFGPGGLFDKFFVDRLAQLVDTSQRPWTWRPEFVGPTRGMLEQFERADRIRRMFFGADSKLPQLDFTVRLSNLSPQATRFYIMIDEQPMDLRPGQDIRRQISWPGKRGVTWAAFEDGVAHREVVTGGPEGPWALFRLVDTAGLPSPDAQADADGVSVLDFRTKLHRAQVTIEASNARGNPFGARDWRQFTCEP